MSLSFNRTFCLLALLVITTLSLGACAQAAPQSAAPPSGASAAAPPSSAAPSQAPSPAASSASTTAPATAAKPVAPAGGALTIYSGRDEKLMQPLYDQIQKDTGIELKVRYGDTAALAAAIIEEGDRSPADLYIGQDAGALGALAAKGRLARLPEKLLSQVEERFRSPSGEWIGISGRARVVVYNTKSLKETDLPDSVLGFTDPKWKGKIGWAPTNGSFQAFVTAIRLTQGEDGARKWLEGIKANEPKVYSNNTAIVDAVGKGEITVGFVNHYYLYSFLAQQGEAFPARNYHPRDGGPGAMVNVAGAGIVKTTKNLAGAERLIETLLNQSSQQYFAEKTQEYPLVTGVQTNPGLTPLSQIKTPKLDLSNLADLEGTLKLMRDTGTL